MTFKEAEDYIHSLKKFGEKQNLDNMLLALSKLNNPQDKLKVFHVAGTNGKGSVCAYLSSVLSQAGYKVGLFISPFITEFCERISINGEYIPKLELARLCEKVKETNAQLCEFEFITAVGLCYFAEQKVDYAVIEVGLGGRLDATNVFKYSLPVITHIGLDHTAILGNTLEKIAKEKCGIIKGGTAVVSPFQESKVINFVRDYVKNPVIPDVTDFKLLSSNLSGNRFEFQNEIYETRLIGEYQAENAVAALTALDLSGIEIPKETVKQGIKNAYIPARNEIISENPLMILDGAHNPLAAKALAAEIKKFGKRTFAVVAVMRDKDYDLLLKEVLPFCSGGVFTQVPSLERALPASELYKTAQKYLKYNVYCVPDVKEALKLAKDKAEGPIFIFGSLYLASYIKNIDSTP